MSSSFLFILFLFHLPWSTATFFGSSRFSNKKYFAHEFQEGKEKFLSQKTVTVSAIVVNANSIQEKMKIKTNLSCAWQVSQSTVGTYIVHMCNSNRTTLYSLTTTTFAKYSTKCSCNDDRRKPNGQRRVRQTRSTENNKTGKGSEIGKWTINAAIAMDLFICAQWSHTRANGRKRQTIFWMNNK